MSIVSRASADQVAEALPTVGGGMRPKLAACVDAIAGGVSSAAIVDGRVPHSLLLELFTDAGQGTMITAA
jgi:acetylglutamate kinase